MDPFATVNSNSTRRARPTWPSACRRLEVQVLADAGYMAEWRRTFYVGRAIDRKIDEVEVTKLLEARSSAKSRKDWAAADAAAAKLVEMDVCYLDDKREWYTRSIPNEQQRARKEQVIAERKARKQSKKRARNEDDTTALQSTPEAKKAKKEKTETKEKREKRGKKEEKGKKVKKDKKAPKDKKTKKKSKGT